MKRHSSLHVTLFLIPLALACASTEPVAPAPGTQATIEALGTRVAGLEEQLRAPVITIIPLIPTLAPPADAYTDPDACSPSHADSANAFAGAGCSGLRGK